MFSFLHSQIRGLTGAKSWGTVMDTALVKFLRTCQSRWVHFLAGISNLQNVTWSEDKRSVTTWGVHTPTKDISNQNVKMLWRPVCNLCFTRTSTLAAPTLNRSTGRWWPDPKPCCSTKGDGDRHSGPQETVLSAASAGPWAHSLFPS